MSLTAMAGDKPVPLPQHMATTTRTRNNREKGQQLVSKSLLDVVSGPTIGEPSLHIYGTEHWWRLEISTQPHSDNAIDCA